MATITVRYNGDEYISKRDTNENIKKVEDFIYNENKSLTKLTLETWSGNVIIGKRAFEESVFIFNYDE